MIFYCDGYFELSYISFKDKVRSVYLTFLYIFGVKVLHYEYFCGNKLKCYFYLGDGDNLEEGIVDMGFNSKEDSRDVLDLIV